MASNSKNANPSKDIEASKTKEEGELSDSSDVENLGCSTAQPSDTAVPPSGPNPTPLAVKTTPPNLAGNTDTGNNLASTVDVPSQQSVPPKSQKNIEKNQSAFKSGNRSWHAHSGGSNNLVIRFSDDDSGSDSEGCTQQKTIEHKSSSSRDGTQSQRPLPSSAPKLLGQTPRNITRVPPKKPLSRTFISSMTKINGGANSRVAGPSSIHQESRVRYFNPRNKGLANQDLVHKQGVGLNNSKLQDLRQQIAQRESELKLRVARLSKETVSASTMNLDNGAGRKLIPTPEYAGLTDPKEPDKKRFKVTESNSAHMNPDAQQDAHPVKSNLVSKDQELGTNILQSRDKIDHTKKVVPVSKAKSSIKWQRKDDKLVDIPSKDTSKLVKGVDMHRDLHQSKRTSRQVDPIVLSNKTASLTNISPSSVPNNLSNMELNPPTKVNLHNPPSSLSKATRELNLSKGSDYREVTSGNMTLEPYFSRKCQASQNTPNPWNCLGIVNISGDSVDMHSLDAIEEKLDKELEEAQQHRHMCEIEERNALKAYRKAQRALIEANARCRDLYRQREICSAQFRSLIVDDSSLLCYSRQERAAIGLGTSNNELENMDIAPTSSHRSQPEYDGFDQTGNINVATRNMSHQHDNGQNLGSEPCSEPDASTSEPFHHNGNNVANTVRSPCSPIISVDEDEETSPMDHDSVRPSLQYQQKKRKLEVIQKNADNDCNNEDSLLLEATLRSELFARLGIKTSSKNIGSCYNGDPVIERGAENDVESERTQLSNGSLTQSEAEKKHQFDVSGPEKLNEVISDALVQNESQHLEKENISKFLCAADPDNNGFSIGCHYSTTPIKCSPSSILRSAIGHMRVMSPVTKDRENHIYSEEGAYVDFDEFELSRPIANSLEEVVMGLSWKEKGSYMCTIAVDPFWPLCMYELRGKCNNDECPFQHVKDFPKRNTFENAHDDSDSADCQLGLTSCQQQCNGPTKLSKSNDFSISPTYVVSLDILKADPHAHQSVVTWKNQHCWWKCFSICITLSSFLQKDLSADEPFLDGDDGRIEVHGSWNKQSSYFQSRNGIANKINQALGTNAQSLEMALLIINQEVNKLEGTKKALSLLSRALEADPASETLWIVYLLIYYGHMNFVGKDDDMFSYAVKNNEGSYELWLMYINSRKQLDDRLAAYDAALSTLCRGASSLVKDDMHTSACILDLFLQMMDCLCMSGNIEKAIQTVYRLLPATTNSDGPHSPMFTDILTCLTISDKCVLWVSCIYLVIYRKLPDALLQQLECEKDLLPVEWPSVHLGNDEKKRVVQLLETVISWLDSYMNVESFKSEDDVRSAQLFALNHIRCMVALDSSECSQNLLEKYIKLYPSCLELVLISARQRENDSGNLGFIGFEEALRNWPKEAPGIQCIWNQYVQHAQQNGNPDLVRELVTRWYHLVWKVGHPESENLNGIDGQNSFVSLELCSKPKPELSASNTTQIDLMFGYLNLSLYKILQNDHVEARIAIDQALRAATTIGFDHCVKEHAMFLLNEEIQKECRIPISSQLKTLNIYLDAAQSLSVSEPLSRHFISKMEKSRVQQLVRSILSPVSSDSSLVNSVLEVWYGPSLLPQTLTEPKSLVDFVEAILGIAPSNYELVFSVCKMLNEGNGSINITPSLLFWASSTLINAIFHGVPIPPEYIWVKAADILANIPGREAMLERFYKKALSVYPFSLNMWQCHHKRSKIKGDGNIVVEGARERGIELN
ncbi:siRNA-mediated silencing protein NRDE-2 [Corchorus olitorius]|uniref:SiRNA-mediated silencing protein NRDE-2 n=1 Tax=Corchorus olitorius TaxID=93759 RepID=A0A1R3JQ53_9ROSI|nr:siRNA-mediated silencing protein NRDE-2 [Corchorus olitorius]